MWDPNHPLAPETTTIARRVDFADEGYRLPRHEYFRDSYAEAHNRPFPLQSTPLRVSHIALLGEETAEDSALEHLVELCQRFGVVPPDAGATCYYRNFGAFELRWERHAEFCTYTVLVHGDTGTPFRDKAIDLIPRDWLVTLPGRLVAAAHVEMLDRSADLSDRVWLRSLFEEERLIGCRVLDGRASVWTAFKLHRDNFNRFLIRDRSLNACQTGRLLRGVLELETYRILTLLAFPLARRLSGKVTRMERRLAQTIASIDRMRGAEEEQRLLHELSQMAASIAHSIAETRYRFDATEAYYALAHDRLKELRQSEIDGLQTLSEFIERRLTPAYRTVEAMQHRMDDLARRIDRASELLRTRIDMKIEAQNQALLRSLDRRIELQLYLQQTVEGLSIVVISSCLVALFSQAVGASKLLPFDLDGDLMIAASVPAALALAWGASLRWKQKFRRLNSDSGQSGQRRGRLFRRPRQRLKKGGYGLK